MNDKTKKTTFTIKPKKEIIATIIKWQEKLSEIEKLLTRFIETHRETIELWIEFSKIYPQLEPYVENIMQGLSDPEFEIANDVVELAHILEAIDLQQAPEAITLIDIISTKRFYTSLIDSYKNTTLDEQRTPLIIEALELHEKEYYAGSICLLYGLIEGVLTESFEKARYIQINGDKVNPIRADKSVDNKSNLTGLAKKLDHASQQGDQLQEYYEKIKTYELVNGDQTQTIPKTRNKILHGGSVNFNSKKRSAQLILWLYSTILHIQPLATGQAAKTIPLTS